MLLPVLPIFASTPLATLKNRVPATMVRITVIKSRGVLVLIKLEFFNISLK